MEQQNQDISQPSATGGGATTQEEYLAGTTNLSLDQLRKEGGTANPDEDNPNGDNPDGVADPDDLHEIQVGDDLDEPALDDDEPQEPIDPDEVNDDNAANPENDY